MAKKRLSDKAAAELMYRVESMDEYYMRPFLGIPSRWRVKKIIGELGDLNKLKILDVGCEVGYISLKLAEKGAKVTAIDFLSEPLERLKEKLETKPDLKKQLIIRQADARKLPFKANQFDVVLAAEVLEHMSNLNSFVDSVKRIIKPKGRLLITFPNEPLREIFYPLLTRLGLDASVECDVTLKSYTPEWMEKKLKNKFELIKWYRLPWWLPITYLMMFKPINKSSKQD